MAETPDLALWYIAVIGRPHQVCFRIKDSLVITNLPVFGSWLSWVLMALPASPGSGLIIEPTCLPSHWRSRQESKGLDMDDVAWVLESSYKKT